MAKIENTTVYPLTTPSADDFIIGTDTSDDNRTVSFSISTLTAAGGIQGLQSVLDTSNVATQNINLTGNITVVGTVAPTTITAAASTGTAGQVLSSTGTGIQWVDTSVIASNTLQEVTTAGNTTTDDIVMSGGDINSTGSIVMNGAAQTLALSNGVDMTLAVNSDITTSGNINLSGGTSVLNFGATAAISDYNSATGSAGQILTVNAAGTGVEWSTGVPAASTPTLQQVLTAGDTAVGNPMNLTSGSILTLDAASNIISDATNTFTATNTFSANGTTNNTSGIGLTGSLWDGASTGTLGQVLTSTATGVSWAAASVGTQDLQSVLGVGNTATNDINLTGSIIPTTITDGVASVGAAAQYLSSTGTGLAWATLPATGVSSVGFSNTNVTSLGPPIVISPATGSVVIEARAYGGGSLRGYVPDGGNVTEFLQGDGTWAVPAVAVTDVNETAPGISTGTPIVVNPTTGNVLVQSMAYDGASNVGHVPTGGTASTFLKGDGSWGGAGGAPEWTTTALVPMIKVTPVAGDYYYCSDPGDPGFPWTWSQGQADALNVTAMPGINIPSNILAENPGKGTCTTSYPNYQMCELSYNFTTTITDTYSFQLWKQPASGGVGAVAASQSISATAGTQYQGTMTIVTLGSNNILTPGDIYVMTVQITTGGVITAFGMHLTFAWTGRA